MKKTITPGPTHDPMVPQGLTSHRGRGFLSEEVYACLKNAILSRKFQPQARLIEEVVARELRVSRTPVRESLHKLEKEGLIEHIPNRGFKVRSEEEGQIAEIFEIRAILEGHLLRSACERVTDEFLSDLKLLIRRAERDLMQSAIEDLHRVNTLFHDRIIQQVSGRERLKGMVRDLREHELYYRSATLSSPGGAGRTLEGHKRIILALEAGDPDLCDRIMRDHIERAKADAIQELTKKRVPCMPSRA